MKQTEKERERERMAGGNLGVSPGDQQGSVFYVLMGERDS